MVCSGNKWIKSIPRYDATLNFYEKGNALILFGGRNDEISDTYALNDLFFFDLLTFDWIKIELYNNDDPSFSVIHRCGHCTLLFDDKIVIFGGMNSQHFVGSALFVINLDFEINSLTGKNKNHNKVSFEPNEQEIQRNKTLKHHTSVNLNSLRMKKRSSKGVSQEELQLPTVH